MAFRRVSARPATPSGGPSARLRRGAERVLHRRVDDHLGDPAVPHADDLAVRVGPLVPPGRLVAVQDGDTRSPIGRRSSRSALTPSATAPRMNRSASSRSWHPPSGSPASYQCTWGSSILSTASKSALSKASHARRSNSTGLSAMGGLFTPQTRRPPRDPASSNQRSLAELSRRRRRAAPSSPSRRTRPSARARGRRQRSA